MKKQYITLENMLKARRIEARLTQADVAYGIGYMVPQMVANYEAGRCKVPEKKFRQVSQMLGVPMREMIDHRLRDERHKLNQKVRLS